MSKPVESKTATSHKGEPPRYIIAYLFIQISGAVITVWTPIAIKLHDDVTLGGAAFYNSFFSLHDGKRIETSI